MVEEGVHWRRLGRRRGEEGGSNAKGREGMTRKRRTRRGERKGIGNRMAAEEEAMKE